MKRVLHLIAHKLDQCQQRRLARCCSSADGILLLEDGVYHCLDLAVLNSDAAQIGALRHDLEARAIPPASGVALLSFDDFASWVADFDSTLNW